MASDPNKWFELWDTLGSLVRSDGAAAAKLQLANIETCDLRNICGAAGIPVKHRAGQPKTKADMVKEFLRALSCYCKAGRGS